MTVDENAVQEIIEWAAILAAFFTPKVAAQKLREIADEVEANQQEAN